MNEWQRELSDSISDFTELKNYIELSRSEEIAAKNNQPFKITPHLLNQIRINDNGQKIRRQFIPFEQACTMQVGFEYDFLRETASEVSENLVQRYPHKAILLATYDCPAYCLFCTRKRNNMPGSHINNLKNAYLYLKNHSEIYDVVVTGGDPLILTDDELEDIFSNLSKIESIKIIRVNTRTPVTIPKRITPELICLLKKYKVSYINIHFEHPDELSKETIDACRRLEESGILLGSQSVLLKGINDDCETLKELFLKLLLAKIRPYYLYQCDKINGCEPFYVNPVKGITIINRIAPELPGLCIPRFVIDTPGKMGKITVAPNGVVEYDENSLTLKNFQSNKIYNYII